MASQKYERVLLDKHTPDLTLARGIPPGTIGIPESFILPGSQFEDLKALHGDILSAWKVALGFDEGWSTNNIEDVMIIGVPRANVEDINLPTGKDREGKRFLYTRFSYVWRFKRSVCRCFSHPRGRI